MKTNGNETIRQLLFVVLLLGMIGGAWYFVFRPRDIENLRMQMQIDIKQKQLAKLNRATATIGDLKVEIADLEKAIDFFQSKLPSEKEMDKVLEEVWRLAEANDLTTKGIYTTRRTGQSAFVSSSASQTEQPIKMQFEGGFDGFYRFLLALENQPRIMRIRQITLEGLGATTGKIRAELEMSIFFEKPSGNGKA